MTEITQSDQILTLSNIWPLNFAMLHRQYTRSQKKCTINSLASPVTQVGWLQKGHILSWEIKTGRKKPHTLKNSSICTVPQKKHNFPWCVSFETECKYVASDERAQIKNSNNEMKILLSWKLSMARLNWRVQGFFFVNPMPYPARANSPPVVIRSQSRATSYSRRDESQMKACRYLKQK